MTLLVVIATVALVLQPPAPPAVAEFAPQAVERIEEAPDVQSSQFGTGDGACAIGQVCEGFGVPAEQAAGAATTTTTSPAPSRRVVDRARVRRCVGDPPRQIEDPQSPPCINYFEGDNGGATAKGVTRDEIRVAVKEDAVSDETYAMAEFFNRRFEFYGRRIRLVEVDWPHFGNNPPVQRAWAERVAEEAEPFAAINVSGDYLDESAFNHELARHRIVSIGTQSMLDAAAFAAARPYLWQYWPTPDEGQRQFVDFACASLVGRPAEHSGAYTAIKRKWAVVYIEQPTPRPTKVLKEGIEACGGGPVPVVGVTRSNQTARIQAMATFQAEDVTTVICVCLEQERIDLMEAAARQQYTPEWPGTGLLNFEDAQSMLNNPGQRNQVFGIGVDNKILPTTEEMWWRAYSEADPEAASQYTFKNWSRYSANEYNYRFYELFLLLASGIQMAGPGLTPEAFERGLHRTRFPNPGAGAAPFWQASVGFHRDYTMIDDAALLYWDESLKDGTDQQGGFCYIDRGTRWRPGTWPKKRQPFFDPLQPCR